MDQCQFEVNFANKMYTCVYIKETSLAEKAVNKLMALPDTTLLGIDTETMALPQFEHDKNAGLNPHLSKVRLLQISDGEVSYIFDMLYIPIDIFITLLETKRFIGHYILFDLQHFKKWGVKNMNVGCSHILTKLIYHSVYPSDEALSASLETMVYTCFKVKLPKPLQVSPWQVMDLSYEQIEYAAIDPIASLEVAKKLSPALAKYSLERIYTLYKAAQHPLVSMQLNGIYFDVEAHREKISMWRSELYEAKKIVLSLTGMDNISGPKLAEYLEEALPEDALDIWPRTEKGTLQTDANAFIEFDYLPVVKPFSEYQKRKTLTSTFGMQLINQVNPVTKRLHSHYNLCGARTGRLSSSAPNLHNYPRDKKGDPKPARSHFVASEGKVLLRADYNQIELRVAAELSQDEAMLNAYRNGIDLHSLTASQIAGKKLEDVTSEERQLAKACNFGLAFGLGAKKFSSYAKKSYKVEIEEAEARQAIRQFRETYSGYHAWQMARAHEGAESLLSRTPCGKLRRLPEENTYGTSMNTPVQGGASECMLHALVRIDKQIDNNNVKLCNSIHDEIIMECPDTPEWIQHTADIIKNSMIDGFTDVFPEGITNGLVDKVTAGKSWADTKN